MRGLIEMDDNPDPVGYNGDRIREGEKGVE
jgi:hypothetical protein